MTFGKFVCVVACDPPRFRVQLGNDGQLHEFGSLESIGHEVERERMNPVFGVV